MKIKAIVFDFDGTILDTEAAEFTIWQEMFESFGLEVPIEALVSAIGAIDAFNPLTYLEERVGPIPAERLRQLDERRLALVALQKPKEGIADWIAAAQRHHLSLAVASSSRRAWVVQNLTQLQLLSHFEVVLGRDDVGYRAKPDPALYQEAVARLGVAPDEAIAVEDSTHGVQAAMAAGLYTLWVPSHLTRQGKVAAAHRTLNSLTDLALDDLLTQLVDEVPPYALP